MTGLEYLITVDKSVFLFVNRHVTNSKLDYFMTLISDRNFWIFLTIFLLAIFLYLKKKSLLRILVMVSVVVLISDAFTYYVMKPYFNRDRPCHQKELEPVRILDGRCAGYLSFPSNHAANSMAGSVAFLLFSKRRKRASLILLLPLLVGFSRIYVGVHFPADILFGYVIGGLLGGGYFLILQAIFHSKYFPNRLTKPV